MFMLHRRLRQKNNGERGFTLVELAIVLAISTTLFAGLWRLISGGNEAMRNQSAADQQKQLVRAIGGYLASTKGQNLLTANNGVPFFTLTLPTSNTNVANCKANLGGADVDTTTKPVSLCDFLPTGFTNATVNSYGQTFSIGVHGDGAGAGVPAKTYSYMILTNGGTTIPDSAGGNIASQIGADGGFVYTNAVCTADVAPTTACGAFGTWNALTTDYIPGVNNKGHLASVSFNGVGAVPTDPWLARKDGTNGPVLGSLPGGSVASLSLLGASTPAATNVYDFNALQTSTYLFSSSASPTFYLAGNTLNGVSTTTNNAIQLYMQTATSSPALYIKGGVTSGSLPCVNETTSDPNHPQVDVSNHNLDCKDAIQIDGNGTILGTLRSNRFYAGQYMYNTQASDIRLKHGIRPITNILADLGKIKAVSFAMNQGNEKKLGVLAQDVEKVYPQLVHNIGGGYKGVDYMGLVGPLVGAVNALKKENDSLKAKLESQEQAIQRLEEKMGIHP